MSRMSSDGSAGVQARSVSSVYTLLLIVALVAAAGSVIFMASVNNSRFGYSIPMGEEYDAAVKTGNALKLDVMTEAGAP